MARRTRRTGGRATRPSGDDCQSDVSAGRRRRSPDPTGRIVDDYLRGRFPFSACVGLNFIHVGDLADGILAVADRGRIGERYLLGPSQRVAPGVSPGARAGYESSSATFPIAAGGHYVGGRHWAKRSAANAFAAKPPPTRVGGSGSILRKRPGTEVEPADHRCRPLPTRRSGGFRWRNERIWDLVLTESNVATS
jgi:hypothetical protein